jgi:hypothetical protein
VGHDRGLHRGVPHSIERGAKLRPPISQKARHGGFTRSHHNYAMDGESSGHSGYDDSFPVDGGTIAETGLSSERCHNHHRGRQAQAHARPPTAKQGAAPRQSKLTGEQAHQQGSRYRDSIACATAEQAHTRSGEDLDGGLPLHSSSGQGGGPPANHEGAKMRLP